MIDSQPQSAIRVTSTTGGSYIIVPLSRLPEVREKLNRHHVQYWVDTYSISLDGKPKIIFIDLGRSEDPTKVQAILDATD